MRAATLILLCGLGSGGLWACEGPCRALAERVCDCSRSPREDLDCEQRISINANNREATEAEEEVCVALLDTCSCAAIDVGRLDLCGLTQPIESLAEGDGT